MFIEQQRQLSAETRVAAIEAQLRVDSQPEDNVMKKGGRLLEKQQGEQQKVSCELSRHWVEFKKPN